MMKTLLHVTLRQCVVAATTLMLGGHLLNAQTNLLANGGFELGNTSGWTTFGNTLTASTAQKRTGSYSGAATSRTASNQTAVINALPLVTAGKTYRFSVWVRLASGSSQSMSLEIARKDANPRTITTLQTVTANSTGWTELTGTFTHDPAGTATELSIYPTCANATRNLYLDDAQLVRVDNLLANGGFELGNTSGWTAVGSAVAASTVEKHSGDYAGRVTGRTAEWNGAWRDLLPLVSSGKCYRIAMWIKPDAGADVTVELLTQQTDNGNVVYKVLQQVVCPAGRWTELSGGFKFVSSGNTTGMNVYLYCLDATRSYYVDDAELRPDELDVDLAATGAPVTQKATGFLFGMSATEPATTYFEPLKPRIVRMDAALGNPDFRGPGTGFASSAYMNRMKAAGMKQQVVISDEYQWVNNYHNSWGWPGDAAHDGYTSYQLLDQVIDNLMNATLASYPASQGWQIEWDIWNEPDYSTFWGRDQAQFFQTWKHAFEKIRSRDPQAVIVGPSIAFFAPNNTQGGYLKDFLIFARDNNVLPDIVSWHEMGKPKEIPAQVQLVRDFMAANGIAARPIDVNEYQGSGEDYMLSPGNTVSFLSSLESTDIRHAIRACWNEDAAQSDWATNGANPGRLDHLMTTAPYQPRALWHVYRSYAEMSGNIAPVGRGGFLSGLASVNAAAGKARILVGNDSTEAFTSSVTIRNLSQLADFSTTGKLRVRVREIPYSGLNALGAPAEISNAILTPAGGELTVPLAVTSRGAYEITLESAAPKVVSITPVTGAGSGQARYRVVFDRAVAGFDSADDVTITGTGASAAFGGIIQESATSYLVTLINVSGAGNITLTVAGTSVTSVPAAESIPVDNFSFENALGAPGGETSNWVTTTWATYAYTAPLLTPVNGTQIAYTNTGGGTLTQILDAYRLDAADQVTLRIDFGLPSHTTWPGASVSVSSVNGPNGTVAMGTFNAAQPPLGGWNTLTIPLTVTSQQAGGFLQVTITNGTGIQTVIDNVRAEVVRAAAAMPGTPSSPAPSLFTLQTSSGGNGAVSRSPVDAAYAAGSLVQLTASPDTGYQLANWSGGAGGSQNPLALTISGATSVTANFALNYGIYEGWSIGKLGSIQPGGDDYDGDGAENLLEYALGLEPATPDIHVIPSPGLAPDGRLQLTYRRNLQATDLTYSVQGVSDLGAMWQNLVNPPTEDLGTAGNIQTLRVTDTEVGAARRFLRLRVQR